MEVVLTALENWFGTDTLELKVSDGELSDSSDIVVTFNPINDAPLIVNLPDSVVFPNDSSATLMMNTYV